MVAGFQTRHDPERGRFRQAGKLHADKAYDCPDLRRWLRCAGILPRIARIGIESGDRFGRHRWVIERTISWLTGYRRLAPRYERYPRNYPAFLGLATALTCYKRLLKPHHVGRALRPRAGRTLPKQRGPGPQDPGSGQGASWSPSLDHP